jgi:hypothetical protein
LSSSLPRQRPYKRWMLPGSAGVGTTRTFHLSPDPRAAPLDTRDGEHTIFTRVGVTIRGVGSDDSWSRSPVERSAAMETPPCSAARRVGKCPGGAELTPPPAWCDRQGVCSVGPSPLAAGLPVHSCPHTSTGRSAACGLRVSQAWWHGSRELSGWASSSGSRRFPLSAPPLSRSLMGCCAKARTAQRRRGSCGCWREPSSGRRAATPPRWGGRPAQPPVRRDG